MTSCVRDIGRSMRNMCTPRRRIPTDETEDLFRLRATIKRLQELENDKNKTSSSVKVDLEQLEKQISANIRIMELHMTRYLKTNGYESKMFHQPYEPDVKEGHDKSFDRQDKNALLSEVNLKLENKLTILEDEYRDVKYRLEILQESESGHEATVERMRKELQRADSNIYSLNDEKEYLKGQLQHLQDKISIKDDEIDQLRRMVKDMEASEERFQEKTRQYENDLQTCRLVIIKLNTKQNLIEAERYRIDGELTSKCREILKLQMQLKDLQEKIKTDENTSKEKTALVDLRPEIIHILVPANKGTQFDINDSFVPHNPLLFYKDIHQTLSHLFNHEWIETKHNLQCLQCDDENAVALLTCILKEADLLCKELCGQDKKSRPSQENGTKRSTNHSICKLQLLVLKSLERNPSSVLSYLNQNVKYSVSTKGFDDGLLSCCTDFLYACTSACWKLNVTYRDLYMEWNDTTLNETPPNNVFSVYTQPGSKLNGVIWPFTYFNTSKLVISKGVIVTKPEVPL